MKYADIICDYSKNDVWSGFMAMWAGIADECQAKRMVRENMMNLETFNAKYGIRTLSKLEIITVKIAF